MQPLFKNVAIDLVSTFHARSFFLYDIILLTDKHDSLFTVTDKPFVQKSASLEDLLSGVYKGSWEVFFKDLLNFKPSQEDRTLSLFLSDQDYLTFLGKFVSSLFPEMPVPQKARIIKSVCDDTRYVKSGGVSLPRGKIYLAFNPSPGEIETAADQTPCKLPSNLTEELRFDWIIGHHLQDPTRFVGKVMKNIKSISYQEFRSIVFGELASCPGNFAFQLDKSIDQVMMDPLLAPCFDDEFKSASYFSDADGDDVKKFVQKYGVDWIKTLGEHLPVVSETLKRYPLEEMIDESRMAAISDNPQELENWFKRLVLNFQFRMALNFPMLSQWFQMNKEGLSVKIVEG